MATAPELDAPGTPLDAFREEARAWLAAYGGGGLDTAQARVLTGEMARIGA